MPEPIIRNKILEHFDNIADKYGIYKEKNNYYYSQVKNLYGELISYPNEHSIIEIGCGTGEILNCLNPCRGVGIDISTKMIEIARRKFKHKKNLSFFAGDAEDYNCFKNIIGDEIFDYCILPDLIEHLNDIQRVFYVLSSTMDRETKLIVTWANPLWSPVLKILENLKLKMPEGPHHWPKMQDVLFNLKKSDFKVLDSGYRLIFPVRISIFSDFINRLFCRIPYFKRACLIQYAVCQLN